RWCSGSVSSLGNRPAARRPARRTMRSMESPAADTAAAGAGAAPAPPPPPPPPPPPQATVLERLFGRWCPPGSSLYLWSRWLFLRALGAIFFSAFYSLAFQIHGVIGTRGILPAA